MSRPSPWVRRLVWVAALVAMALGLRTTGTEGSRRVDQEIRELLDQQLDAWNAGDLEGFLGTFASGDDLVFASGDSWTEGFDDVAQRYRQRYDTPEKMGRLEFDIHRIDPLGAAHAKVLGAWRLVREAETPHGLFTLIAQRGDDGWFIAHDHTSTATP